MQNGLTLIAVNVLILQETLRWYYDWNSNENYLIKLARDSIKIITQKTQRDMKLITLKLDKEIKGLIRSYKDNRLLNS